MTPEERDQAYHTLITCDGKGKDAKAETLHRLIHWHRLDAADNGFSQLEPISHLAEKGRIKL